MDTGILMIIAVVCAYIVKGVCGFANTLIFTSISSFQSASVDITPVDLLIGIPANILLAVRERKAVMLKAWLPLAAMVVIGSIPGIFLLKYGGVASLKRILGVAVFGIGIEMLLREHQIKKRKYSSAALFIIGIASGFLCGLFGIGALLAAYMGRTTDTTDAFRGNLSMVFLVDNGFRLIVYISAGIMTWTVAKNALLLLPFMLLGLGVGMILSKIIDERIMKRIVSGMLIISGISLCLTNLL